MGGKTNRKKRKLLHIVLLVCVFVLSALYFFEANSIAEERYATESATKRIEQAKEANRALEIEVAEINSLHNLEFLSSALDLEKVKKVSYIQVKATSPLVLNQ